jgi:hypothetical protein
LLANIQGPCSKSFYLEHNFERNKKQFWKDVEKKFTKQSGVTSQSEHGRRKGIDEGVVDNGIMALCHKTQGISSSIHSHSTG